jgi:hypothetical protein
VAIGCGATPRIKKKSLQRGLRLRGKETPYTQAAEKFAEEEEIDAGVKCKVEVDYHQSAAEKVT